MHRSRDSLSPVCGIFNHECYFYYLPDGNDPVFVWLPGTTRPWRHLDTIQDWDKSEILDISYVGTSQDLGTSENLESSIACTSENLDTSDMDTC